MNSRWRLAIRRTVNLGDYNSITLDAELEEDLPEGTLSSEHTEFMFKKIGKVLEREFAKHGVSPK